jgi:enamine deaminase RidA (YjgF/YER057c/UK114 family)
MTAIRVLLAGGAEPFSHYCDVVRAGDLVFVSGMVAVSPDRRVVGGGDVTEQARIALDLVGRALASVGATPADVVKMSNYLIHIADEPKLDGPRREFFGDTLPASVLVEVNRLVLPGLLYEVAVVAVIGRPIQRITLDSRQGTAPYCDVVRVGDLVFVSGRTSLSTDGEVQSPGDATGQARIALAQLGAALESVGAGPEDVVTATNYLTAIDDRPRVNIARREFFGETLPASLLCEVPALFAPGLLYEVEAVAVVGGEKQRVLLDDFPPPFSHYCDVVRSGDMVWVSGLAAVSSAHDVQAPGDATEQARIALAALGRCLQQVGAGPADVVRVNNYLTNIDDRERVNVARREFFGATRPASFLCEISRLVVPGLLYEIEAFAVIGAGEKA